MGVLNKDVIGALLDNVYGFEPASVASLSLFDNPDRGVYRVEDAQGQAWLLRLARQTSDEPWMLRPASVLQWLDAQSFPAPRVRPTLTGALVGTHAGWWSCLLTFVHGHMIEPQPAPLGAVGAALAQLHALGLTPGAAALPPSPWHPATAIPTTLEALSAAAGLPSSLQPLRQGLAEAAHQLEQRTNLPLSLVHGDCWHTNAIQTEHGGIVFVDWDGAGRGLPVLDLGQILLASHYDLAQPLRLQPDPKRMAAILAGYTVHRSLLLAERQALLAAMRFGLAYRFAPALVEAAQGQRDVEDVAIRKLQLRFDACAEIAAIADDSLA